MTLKEKRALRKKQREVKRRKKKAQKEFKAAMDRLKVAGDELQIGMTKGMEETADVLARLFRSASQAVNERAKELEPKAPEETTAVTASSNEEGDV